MRELCITSSELVWVSQGPVASLFCSLVAFSSLNMPKAKKVRIRDSNPFQNANEDGMDVSEAGEAPFKPSVLAGMDVATSKSSKKKGAVMLPEDASPLDGMNQEESEKALLDALMPTLPKQKGFSVRISNCHFLHLFRDRHSY